jgi:REP element-mobilizing transposase RayT
MDKFKNKYRIPSARAQWWDYGQNAAYFVTICTAHRNCYFGTVVETPKLGVSTIQLSEIGKTAYDYWAEIPKHFPFVILGEFIIMPNHVHGIVIIDKQQGDPPKSVETPKFVVETPKFVVETPKLGASTTKTTTTKTGGKNEQWYSGTLGVIINQYKRYCTIQIRKIHTDFAWQTRFHDHVIRNHDEYKRIENYIVNNPSNWKDDKFHK